MLDEEKGELCHCCFLNLSAWHVAADRGGFQGRGLHFLSMLGFLGPHPWLPHEGCSGSSEFRHVLLQLLGKGAVPCAASQIEFGSADIHRMCRSRCWALWGSHWPLLGSCHLQFGPGHSEDVASLHTLSSARWRTDGHHVHLQSRDFVGLASPSWLSECLLIASSVEF